MNPRTLLIAALLVGCGDTEPEAPPAQEDPCPNIGMDSMDGRWIKYDKKADQTWRFEIATQGTTSGKPELWFTNGGWTKRRMVGEKRASDWRFTEVPEGRRKAAFEAGSQSLVRLFVEPRKQKCSLRTSVVELKMVDGAETEVPKPGFTEYIEFPAQYDFTFRPCDGPLFVGAAASSKAAADQQVEELQGPDPAVALGDAIAIAAWSEASADGDPSCSYDMDLFFDDQPAKDKDGDKRGPVPAGDVQDGVRHWSVTDWYAPYSGNHHFQAFRYRTCGGGERELIGVSCLEAVMQ